LKKYFDGESATRFVRSRSRIEGISLIRRESATPSWRIWAGRSPNDFFNGQLGGDRVDAV